MTTYILVHGAWHGAWAWDRVAPALRDAGHHVMTPTLPDLPGTTLSDHVNVVRRAIEASAEPATVVAHSYAGVVAIQSVAAVDPSRVDSLVLVDGWITSAGESLLDVAPAWFAQWCHDNAEGSGDLAVLPAPPASTLGLEDQRLAEFVEAHMTPQPLRTFTDPATLTLDHPDLPRHAIACVPSMFPFIDLARAFGCSVHEIRSDHEVMLSRPDELLHALQGLSPARTR
jgi:pimeloyl-ACP methyl ester carboxylesterase